MRAPQRQIYQLRNELAAIDLGSNSFHMVIAEHQQDRLYLRGRRKLPVRLGFGIDETGGLNKKVQKRALRALAEFGERVAHLPQGAVRCVGTRTFRAVHDVDSFLHLAEQVLGHPIEVISGEEEARLIYLGVIHSLGDHGGSRLVVDIGGGSTELIVGQGLNINHKASLDLGCVSMTREFFADGKVTAKRLHAAMDKAISIVETCSEEFARYPREVAVGASGTIKAALRICSANGWSDPGITRHGLQNICDCYLQAGRLESVELAGLRSNRRPVLLGGVVVLAAVFDVLGIDSMTASQGALREGLLYEMADH